MNDEMLEKLIVWLFFSVLLALVPILFDVMRSTIAVRSMVAGGTSRFDDAVARGELFLMTAALCGAAVGELFGVGGPVKIGKIIAGGSAVVTLFFSALFYTEVSAAARRGSATNKVTVRNFSCVLFVLGVICSGACIALSKVV